MLTDIASAFGVAKKKYDKGGNALAETILLGARSLVALNSHATLRPFGMFYGPPKIEYWVADDKGALNLPAEFDRALGLIQYAVSRPRAPHSVQRWPSRSSTARRTDCQRREPSLSFR